MDVVRNRNIFTRIRNGVRDIWNGGTRKFNQILAWGLGVDAVVPRLWGEKGIEEGYAKVLAIFALINKDASKFASIPRYVYDAKAREQGTGRRIKVDGDQYRDLLALLANPNPYQTQGEFTEFVRIMYKCDGNAYVWLNRGDVAQGMVSRADGTIEFYDRTDKQIDEMPVLEMYVLPSGFVGIIPDPTNVFGVLGYWFETGDGQRKFIRRGDMIHWKRPNPKYDYTTGEHLRGLSPTEVASCDIEEMKQISKSTLRMHKNDGVKAVAINKGLSWDDLDETQKAAVSDTVNNRLNGNDVKGSVAFLGGGDWDIKTVGLSSVDLDTLKAKELKWKELCFLYDVPHNFFDNNSKYSNAGEWQKSWIYNSIAPDSNRWDQKLTERLARAFKLHGKVEISGDVMSLPELQRDLKQLSDAFMNMWYVTPNQKLVACGYEPVADPKFNEPWLPMGITPLSQYGQEQVFQEDSEKLDDDER